MHWTHKYPDRPSWWWFRYELYDEVIETIFEITQDGPNGKLLVNGDSPLAMFSGEWSSEPVPRPEESK